MTTETLYEKEIERPRVVLRANSHCGSQDLHTQKARSSWETRSDAQSFRETGCNIEDHRIPGISISTVQEQDERRQHKVAQLIEMFESHKQKDQFLEDMSQTKKINRFSEASQELLKDMNHTEIFELCENSKKLQCPDCNSFTDSGIIFCSCGRNLKHGRSVTQLQKDNNDLNSIDGYVIKKNSSRGPKHGQSERQMRFHKAEEMLRKAKKQGNPTILSRWVGKEKYRSPLTTEGFREEDIWNFDQLALEKHDYMATRSERLRYSQQCVLIEK